ncbi:MULTISPECIES: hypothetical protein [unclassified Crossiella]|uniref:hypothetical protein n=1 Tax=unclassified Crossiella TaxID=2620835 RepID=UPI001FFEA608|nr:MULTISPECIES: hypothetical protein [unclassified Crossiella]MCK2243687.1 hypothetical protein [Crossiella sp. S99.2]MCK2257546.1 hypothetical protein [Crossiella sp. S99.1]
MDSTVVGTGVLNWNSLERHTDRYGTVHLHSTANAPSPVSFDHAPIGARGHLVAVILEAPPALTHWGSTHRGEPEPVTVGTEVTLGTGTLFVESSPDGDTEIGVRPDDGREENWLDPTALIRCWEHTVRLELRPDNHP